MTRLKTVSRRLCIAKGLSPDEHIGIETRPRQDNVGRIMPGGTVEIVTMGPRWRHPVRLAMAREAINSRVATEEDGK